MNYFELISALKKNRVSLFSLSDIKNLFPDEKPKTLKNNLVNWVAKGRLLKLRKDLYEVVEPGMDSRAPDLYIANRLYAPSYVSLETALSIYSVIPDIASGVTSVTTRPTRTFKNKYGLFLYRTCQKRAFTGYKLMLYEGVKVYVADIEKALVDFLYYRLRDGYSLDFKEERLNKKILKKADWQKALRYAALCNAKTLRALKECRRYLGC
ncbi:MAG: hypothetical protein HZC16_02320 [Candidatus Omnitrophica bacterium]|nr:hypothetical protein [Candidatus Omnitrophota bacterium]